MAASPQHFAQLLTEGIHRIRIKEGKSTRVIQDELGYLLGRAGGSVIEHWRKGRLPPHLADVEQLARVIVARALLDQVWLEAFLKSAGHPAPFLLGRELFPNRVAAGSPDKEAKTAAPSSLLTTPPLHNLPTPPTPLIGRAAEIAMVTAMLRQEDTWLVTLSGPGGSGKTRLAIEIAWSLAADFTDGVFFVELASVVDADLVLPTIAHVLGLQQRAGQTFDALLQEYVRGKRLLLVLDNFEQIVTAAPRLAVLHQHTPGVALLVTSRTLLRLRGEKEVPVPPLQLPAYAEQAEQVEQAAQAEAVQLFVARVQDVQHGFMLAADNAAAVVAICTQLDGLPLALELAAARAHLLTVHALRRRLADPLAFLTHGPRDLPDRQQTLRAAIAWSVGLLTEAEQTFFRRLAVFRGGFSLESVAPVCTMAGDLDEDVLDLLTALVECNLVRPSPSSITNESRFTLLETIREYARMKLQESGEAEVICRRHTDFFLALAETMAGVWGVDQGVWIVRIGLEHDNLRAALAWSLQSNATAIAARLVWALLQFWTASGSWSEGRAWAEAVLAQTNAGDRTAARAQALVTAGILTQLLGDDAAARTVLQEGLAIARELGAKSLIPVALVGLSFVASAHQNRVLAVAHLMEAQEIAREIGNKYELASTLSHLGGIARQEGDYARAQALYKEGFVLFQEMGADWDAADGLAYLGLVAQAQGDHERAGALFHESLARWRALGTLQWKGVADCLEGIAAICAGEQRFDAAVRLFAAAEKLRKTLAGHPPQLSWPPAEDKPSGLRAQLGEAAFVAAWEAGYQLSTQTAVELALAQPRRSLVQA